MSFEEEVIAAIRSGRLEQPFNAEMVREACPGWSEKTYQTFFATHSVGRRGKPALFDRVGHGIYQLKQ